jgi:NAD(P)H-dependent FMN reductase
VTTIVGFSGSLRKLSHNSALLAAAAAAVQPPVQLTIAPIREIPLYDGDVEVAQGLPPPVRALKEAIAAADGLLIVTPEYNNSIPGVAKNVIDWLSRPAADIPRVFGGRPVAVIGASLGGFGTILSQNAWLSVLRTLGTDLYAGGRLMVSHAATVFDANGQITSEPVRQQLQTFMAGFVEFVQARERPRPSG